MRGSRQPRNAARALGGWTIPALGGFTHQVGEALRNSVWPQSWAPLCSGCGWTVPRITTLPAWIVLGCYDLYLMYGYMNCGKQPGSNSKWSVKWLMWRLVPSVMINMAADGELRVFPVSLHVLRPSISKYSFLKNSNPLSSKVCNSQSFYKTSWWLIGVFQMLFVKISIFKN